MKFLVISMVTLYIAFNLVVARLLSARQMKESYIDNQCVIGRICAGIFYAPAWILKGIRWVVVYTIK